MDSAFTAIPKIAKALVGREGESVRKEGESVRRRGESVRKEGESVGRRECEEGAEGGKEREKMIKLKNEERKVEKK